MPKKAAKVRDQEYFRPSGPAKSALSDLLKEWGDDKTSAINSSLIISSIILTGPTADALRAKMTTSGKSLPDVLVDLAAMLVTS